jgi:hypothetical protein
MIMAQVGLGKGQADKALSLKQTEKVSRLLREAHQLQDGKWLSIPVQIETDVDDVEQLLIVKMRSSAILNRII